MDDRMLGIYMNDQLALGVLWREVAHRCARQNAATDAGPAIGAVADAIGEDVAAFEQMMGRLNLRRSPVKPRLARAAERLGRAKRNGHLASYSPLSRFEELDLLLIGIGGKLVLWENLRDHAALGTRLPDVDFGELIARAERQRAQIAAIHARAGRAAFFGTPVDKPAPVPAAGA